MKTKLIILTTVVLLSFSGILFAHEGMEHDEGMEAMDHEKGAMMNDQMEPMMEHQEGTEEKAQAVEVGNKICPVSGDEIPAPGEESEMGDEVVKYEYNGKIYNLCCKMCIKDFKKDPEKYSKIADDEVAKAKMMEDQAQDSEDHPQDQDQQK